MSERQTDRDEEASAANALRSFKADVFQVLAHATRIHIVECLRDGEVGVKVLLEATNVEAANLSQHLNLLKSKRLIDKRKDGNHVYYSLRDPLLIEVLDTMRRYFQKRLEEDLAMFQATKPIR